MSPSSYEQFWNDPLLLQHGCKAGHTIRSIKIWMREFHMEELIFLRCLDKKKWMLLNSIWISFIGQDCVHRQDIEMVSIAHSIKTEYKNISCSFSTNMISAAEIMFSSFFSNIYCKFYFLYHLLLYFLLSAGLIMWSNSLFFFCQSNFKKQTSLEDYF